MYKKMICLCMLFLCLFILFGSAANLVENGTFSLDPGEQYPADWTMKSYRQNAEFNIEDQDGKNTLVITAGKADHSYAMQTVSVTPGSFYKISARAKATNVAGTKGVNIGIHDTTITSDSLHGATDFEMLELYVTPVSDSITILLSLGGYGAEASGMAYFQDVAVEEQDPIIAAQSSIQIHRLPEVITQKDFVKSVDPLWYVVGGLLLITVSICVYYLYVHKDRKED